MTDSGYVAMHLNYSHTELIISLLAVAEVITSFYLNTTGWPDSVGLHGWLHSEVVGSPVESPILALLVTGATRRRVTSLTETNVLPLSHATNRKVT